MTSNLCEPCKAAGLAILPVRYAPVPKNIPIKLPSWANAEKVTKINLGSEFHYSLRTLRAGYIYLFSPKSARGSNQWECYMVTKDGCLLKELSTTSARPSAGTVQCSRHGADNTIVQYIVIPQPEKCAIAYIAFSEHKWGEQTIADYTKNATLRAARMQRLQPASMIAGTGVESGKVLTAQDIENSVLEYTAKPVYMNIQSLLPDDTAKVAYLADREQGSYKRAVLQKMSTQYEWANRAGQAEKVYKQMASRTLYQGKPAKPHIFAIHDALGAAQELNGYVNDAAGKLEQYKNEWSKELFAYNAINGVKEALKKKVVDNIDQFERMSREQAAGHVGLLRYPDLYEKANKLNYSALDSKSRKAARKAIDEEAARRDEEFLEQKRNTPFSKSQREHAINHAWDRYDDNVSETKLNNFKKLTEAFAQHVQALMDLRVIPLLAWLDSDLLTTTLNDFHQQCIPDGILFEQAVASMIDGINATSKGSEKLQQWAVMAATNPKNLIWRTMGLNQKEVLTELDPVVQKLVTDAASFTPAEAIMWTNMASKTLKSFASAYKTANSVLNDNAGIDKKVAEGKVDQAFKVTLKKAKTFGTDKFMMTVGDIFYKKFFRVERLGYHASEAMIHMMMGIRCYCHPADVEHMIRQEAMLRHSTRKSVLKEIKRLHAVKTINPAAFNNHQTHMLRQAWSNLTESGVAEDKKSANALKALKDTRLAAMVGIFELLNTAKLLYDCKTKGDWKSYALLAASMITVIAAVLDVASVPAKMLEARNITAASGKTGAGALLGKPSYTYQQLKALGGSLASTAAIIIGVVDIAKWDENKEKGNALLARLYFLKGSVGISAGLIGFATMFTYSAQMLSKLPILSRVIVMQGVEVGAAIKGTEIAVKLVGRRILLMAVGGWLSVAVFAIQIIIWMVEDNALEEWLDAGPFAAEQGGKPYNSLTEVEQGFEKAIADVGI